MSMESKSWYRMTRPVFNSGFEDDEFWTYGQDGFQELLHSFLGRNVLVYDKTIHKEPKKLRAIVQNVTGDTQSSATVRQILCEIGTLRCGQYVKCDGAMWMVSSFPDNNRVYEKAVLWKCQYNIRFISPLTGNIVEYPTYGENSTQYGTGEETKTNLDVGSDQHLIYIPYNQETIMLDNGFRFLMDKRRALPTAYYITRVDPVSYAVGSEYSDDGLIQWSVLQTPFNERTDNKELMIADYYPLKAGSADSTHCMDGTLVLCDLDGDFMLALGETKCVQVKCVRANGEELEVPSYTLEYEYEDGAVQIEDEGENIISLKASRHERYVGTRVKIHAVSEETDTDADLEIQIVHW